MKKVILTEAQVENLVSKFVTEQVPATRETEYTMDDGRYRMQCEFDFEYGYDNLIRYKGGEIDNIDKALGEVTFSIDTQSETYGITEMKVTDIRGPKEIKVKIKFYPEGSSSEDKDWWEKRITEEVNIPLDWRKIEIDDSGYKMNYIGVNKRITVGVLPDGNGGLIGKKIEIEIKNLAHDED
jgi:hypothetical protein